MARKEQLNEGVKNWLKERFNKLLQLLGLSKETFNKLQNTKFTKEEIQQSKAALKDAHQVIKEIGYPALIVGIMTTILTLLTLFMLSPADFVYAIILILAFIAVAAMVATDPIPAT